MCKHSLSGHIIDLHGHSNDEFSNDFTMSIIICFLLMFIYCCDEGFVEWTKDQIFIYFLMFTYCCHEGFVEWTKDQIFIPIKYTRAGFQIFGQSLIPANPKLRISPIWAIFIPAVKGSINILLHTSIFVAHTLYVSRKSKFTKMNGSNLE